MVRFAGKEFDGSTINLWVQSFYQSSPGAKSQKRPINGLLMTASMHKV